MTVCGEIRRGGRELGRNSAHFRGRDSSRLERVGFPCDVNLASGAKYSVVSARLEDHYPSLCPDLPLIGAQPFSEGRQDRAGPETRDGEPLESKAAFAQSKSTNNNEKGGFTCGTDLSWHSVQFLAFRPAGKLRANRRQLAQQLVRQGRCFWTEMPLRAQSLAQAQTWPTATQIRTLAKASAHGLTPARSNRDQHPRQGVALSGGICVGEASVALHRRARRA